MQECGEMISSEVCCSMAHPVGNPALCHILMLDQSVAAIENGILVAL